MLKLSGIVAFYTFPPAYNTWKALRDSALPEADRGVVDTNWLPSPPDIRGMAAASFWGFGLMGVGFLIQATGTLMGSLP